MGDICMHISDPGTRGQKDTGTRIPPGSRIPDPASETLSVWGQGVWRRTGTEKSAKSELNHEICCKFVLHCLTKYGASFRQNCSTGTPIFLSSIRYILSSFYLHYISYLRLPLSFALSSMPEKIFQTREVQQKIHCILPSVSDPDL
jgi:hypothetical protein